MPLFLSLLLLLVVDGQGRMPALTPEMQKLFDRGIEAQKKQDLDAAEKLFKELLDSGGRIPAVYNALGNVYQMKGVHAAALKAFDESQRLNPEDPNHHSLAGVSLLALGRSRKAIQEFQEAVRLQPENPVFREQLARGLLRLKDYPELIDQYRKLLELRPENPEYHYQAGKAYLAYSVSCFERMEKIDAGSARLFQQMGDQYLAQGKLDKAIESYEKARAADPSIPEIHFLLGQFYWQKGYRDKALDAVNKALALTPGSPAARALKSSILGGNKP